MSNIFCAVLCFESCLLSILCCFSYCSCRSGKQSLRSPHIHSKVPQDSSMPAESGSTERRCYETERRKITKNSCVPHPPTSPVSALFLASTVPSQHIEEDLFMDNQGDIEFLHCNHIFHKNCIREWFHKNPTCPICRKKISFF